MAFHNPFDFEWLIINSLFGSTELFAIGSFIILAIGAAYFKLEGPLYLAFFGLFIVLIAAFVPPFYLLAIILAAIILGVILSKMIKN